jgi:hypothetical protein
MFEALLNKQLVITVNNDIGTLAEVTDLISSSGINLIAICAYGVDNKGIIMFVSADNKKAQRLLKAKKYDVREEEVILLTIDNKPGSLQFVTEKIAEAGIDLTLIYGSVDKKATKTRLVVITEDNRSVLMMINRKLASAL